MKANISFILALLWLSLSCASDQVLSPVTSSPFQMTLSPTAEELDATATTEVELAIKNVLLLSASLSDNFESVYDIDVVLLHIEWQSGGIVGSLSPSTMLQFEIHMTFQRDKTSGSPSQFSLDSLIARTFSQPSTKSKFIEELITSGETPLYEIQDVEIQQPEVLEDTFSKGATSLSLLDKFLIIASASILLAILYVIYQHHRDIINIEERHTRRLYATNQGRKVGPSSGQVGNSNDEVGSLKRKKSFTGDENSCYEARSDQLFTHIPSSPMQSYSLPSISHGSDQSFANIIPSSPIESNSIPSLSNESDQSFTNIIPSSPIESNSIPSISNESDQSLTNVIPSSPIESNSSPSISNESDQSFANTIPSSPIESNSSPSISNESDPSFTNNVPTLTISNSSPSISLELEPSRTMALTSALTSPCSSMASSSKTTSHPITSSCTPMPTTPVADNKTSWLLGAQPPTYSAGSSPSSPSSLNARLLLLPELNNTNESTPEQQGSSASAPTILVNSQQRSELREDSSSVTSVQSVSSLPEFKILQISALTSKPGLPMGLDERSNLRRNLKSDNSSYKSDRSLSSILESGEPDIDAESCSSTAKTDFAVFSEPFLSGEKQFEMDWSKSRKRALDDKDDISLDDIFQIDIEAHNSAEDNQSRMSGLSAVSEWMKSIRVIGSSSDTKTSETTNSSAEHSVVPQSTQLKETSSVDRSLEHSMAASLVEV